MHHAVRDAIKAGGLVGRAAFEFGFQVRHCNRIVKDKVDRGGWDSILSTTCGRVPSRVRASGSLKGDRASEWRMRFGARLFYESDRGFRS